MLKRQERRHRRHKRVRAKMYGIKDRPRLCIFRSGRHLYAQLIDDNSQKTLTAASDLELKSKKISSEVSDQVKTKEIKKTKEKNDTEKTRKVAIAYQVGKLIAKKALQKKIERIVFDRGGYKYHGRVKALAEGARKGGLKF